MALLQLKKKWWLTLCFITATNFFAGSLADIERKSWDILMRNAIPEQPDAYLCSGYEVTEPLAFIYKFEALANISIAHHILLYGCDGDAYSSDPIWNCPAVCQHESSTILFAWAKNAPATVLPEGVGLRIGKMTSVRTLVLQVHYSREFKQHETGDTSGIRIFTTSEKQPYVAGIFLMMATSFVIPPNESAYPVDISCDFNMKKSIFPFAYRTHAHSLGTVITAYQYNGSYHEIGKGNPQWPQAFYPVKEIIEVKPGNSLVARCTYNSSVMTYPVSVGSTGRDEMCNFYIMFYVDSSVENPSGRCIDNRRAELTGEHLPADVSIPLPSDPLLDEEATGHHQHNEMVENTLYKPLEPTSIPFNSSVKDILMKGAKPRSPDAYICTTFPVTEEEIYIYKFEAMANVSTAHHMLLYGCDGESISSDPMWNCPPMCQGKSTILFAWAKNAPPTVLPKDVGFKIGKETSVKTLVLQVHYARSFYADEKPDHSGIRLHLTRQKQPYAAGIFLLAGSFFSVPPGNSSYPVDVSCLYDRDKSIYPFAFRAHAHSLGRVITGYQYNGSYHQIGKGNPQWPQAFYPVQDMIEVKPGDYLAARCTYDSTAMGQVVRIGSTGNDEMCNFYIMFYANSSGQDPAGTCSGNLYPALTGANFPEDVSEPLPSNLTLEEAAQGHQHHNHDSEGSITVAGNGIWIRDIIMKGAKPEQPDAYLCSSYSVQEEETYIYKFEALANVSAVHHILMYGCNGEPFSKDPIWNCRPMCEGPSSIMFAWAKNAPPTLLPKDVGLKIGKKSSIKSIVLQVHYARTFTEQENPDKSGVRLHLTNKEQPYIAGVFLLQDSSFFVPPGNPSYSVDISCLAGTEKSIFPFAFRTHSHALGKVITGYLYNGTYYQIGKGNPQWPQAFYPVEAKIEVKPEDYLVARCTYDSTSVNERVNVGSTAKDEMCNFYMMFYTANTVEVPSGRCSGNRYRWLTGVNLPADVSDPLPSNFTLEEEAKGPKYNGQSKIEIQEFSESNFGKVSNVMLSEKYSQNRRKNKHADHAYKDMKLESPDELNPSITKGENDGEIIQYALDFDDADRSYVKRQHPEYYEDFAANDIRDKNVYQTSKFEDGLSRNRNKQFEAINQQLQPSSSKHHHLKSSQQLPFTSKQRLKPIQQPVPVSLQNDETRVNTGISQLNSRLSESETKSDTKVTTTGKLNQALKNKNLKHSLVYNTTWPSKDVTFGQIGGVATDSDGNIYVFHRGSRQWTASSFSLNNDFNYQDSPILEDVIVVMNKAGQLIHKFGAGQYFMPHGIEVDRDGNIWLTDVALHQVFKIPHGDDKPGLVLGHRFQHGSDHSYFCKPTDVAVLQSGEFYVSDGYCNGRVLKFSKDGKVIKTWGQKSLNALAPPADTFNIPHGITVSEENNLVCVADRENGRIQCFDLDGSFKHIIKHPTFGSRMYGVEQSPFQGGVLYAVNGPSYDGPNDFSVQGFTLDIKTGDILEIWDTPQHLQSPHDVCTDPAGHAVYVGELSPAAVWKFSRTPQDQADSNNNDGNLHSFKVDNSKDDKLQHDHVTASSADNMDTDTYRNNKTALSVNGGSESDSTSLTPSIVIGCLLVIPVILLLVITLLVRAHQSGKLKCYGHGKRHVFNLQSILGNSHKGFDPLSTEESDHELDPDDCDQNEYVVPKKTKRKA